MHSEDALELKFTWEVAQEYLRPPISKPIVVTIENCELEEYNVEEVIKMMEMELGDGWIFHKDCKAHRHYGWRSRKRSSNAGKWQLMMVGCKDVDGNLLIDRKWFSSG
ncbi:hypothetical protein Hanom_Chr12g01112521 [Helianthus anomalus]